ncbi:hypothetical protein IF2G_03590 [Cordyceps javanica]|nr:hypothetical protein IF2G_03590 [Cordyceps javanica]
MSYCNLLARLSSSKKEAFRKTIPHQAVRGADGVGAQWPARHTYFYSGHLPITAHSCWNDWRLTHCHSYGRI